MSLSYLTKTDLPLNRSEHFYACTVFPMIVAANGFRDLRVLARLIPGCALPPIDADPESTNIQFFTEFSLIESILDQRTEARFPDPPQSENPPSIMILVKGDRSILVAIEAEMFHRSPLYSLVKRLQTQRAQLAYLQERLGIDVVHHAVLLPSGYAAAVGSTAIPAGDAECPIITWEGLLAAYRRVRSGDDYFMGMLDIALERWDGEYSRPLAQEAIVRAELHGWEIVERFAADPSLSTMSRAGGIYGQQLRNDMAAGAWRTQLYEVSSAPKPAGGNWFCISDFVQLVANASPADEPTADAG